MVEMTGKNGRGFLRPSILLAALFVLSTWPHILLGTSLYDSDEKDYYYPSVQAMASNWPFVNPCSVETMSAAGPLYPYLLASLPAPIIRNLTILKLVSSLISLLVLILVYRLITQGWGSEWKAMVLTLPVLASQCFQVGSIYLVTDNVALLLAIPAFFQPLVRAGKPGAALWASLFASLATAVRQLYAWLAVPLVAGNLLQWAKSQREQKTVAAGKYVAAAVVALVGPAGVVAWLFIQWGGLVPPRWQVRHGGFNPAAIPFTLGLFGLYTVAFSTAMVTDFKALGRSRITVPAVLATLAAWALIPNDYNEGANRCQGMMWWLIRLGPSFHERSLVLLVLAPVGVLGLVHFFLEAQLAGEGLSLGALYLGLVAWLAAQTRNPQLYQKYYDVFLLACVAVWTSRYGLRSPARRGWWTGPVLLTIITFALTNLRFLRWM